MPIHPLDILDLPVILKYRHQVLPLDSARSAIHGNPLGFKLLFSYMNPRREISTAICRQKGRSLLGQVTHLDGSPHAKLSFIAPGDGLDAAAADLLDYLAKQAGEWGCLHVLAEVDEESSFFPLLRKAGYSMYAWQRIWKITHSLEKSGDDRWGETSETDLISIQNLYAQIVPAMLQPIEPLPRQAVGMVCRQNGELQAFIHLTYGQAGIWIQPLIHPEAGCLSEWMSSLFSSIPNRFNQPVYVCVRSYQAWLENLLEDIGGEAGNRQAVMIKHLAAYKRVEEALPAKNKEPAWAKPATPVAQVKNNDGEL